MNETNNVKPGWKTSEFWLALLGVGAQFAGGVPTPTGMIVSAALGGLYTLGRSYVKAKAAPVSLHADDYKKIITSVADAAVTIVPAAGGSLHATDWTALGTTIAAAIQNTVENQGRK